MFKIEAIGNLAADVKSRRLKAPSLQLSVWRIATSTRTKTGTRSRELIGSTAP